MSQFEVVAVLDKQNHRDFTDICVHRVPHALFLAITAGGLIAAFSGVFPWYGSLLCIAIALLSLAWFLLSSHVLAWMGWQRRVSRLVTLPTTYAFTDEEITRTHPDFTDRCLYGDIQQAFETDDCFFLISAKQGYLLPKTCFTQGSAHEFAAFLEEKGITVRRVPLVRNRRRRITAAFAAVVLSIGLVTAAHGYTYLRRSVTIRNGDAACTLSLPRFLEEQPSFGIEPLYTGNEIVVSAEYFTHAQLQWKFDNNKVTDTLSLAAVAKFEQSQKTVPEKGEWVSDENVENEVYMQYAQGAEYVCTVLHWTEKGCCNVELTCPGERQDTYYNRFNLWRLSATYHE